MGFLIIISKTNKPGAKTLFQTLKRVSRLGMLRHTELVFYSPGDEILPRDTNTKPCFEIL